MKLPDSFLLFPIKRAWTVIAFFLLITLACVLFIFFRHDAALQKCLNKKNTWQQQDTSKQNLTAPIPNTLLVGIRPTKKQTPLLSPKGLQSIYAIDATVERLAASENEPPRVAPHYITAQNIDLIVPGELGSIALSSFLRPAPENQEQAEQLFRQVGDDPLLNTLVLSSTRNHLLYHLPLTSNGSTSALKTELKQATNKANTVHLLFGGLTYITETYLAELHKDLPLYFAVTVVIIALIIAILTSSIARTAGVVATTLCATILIYAVQVSTSFPTTFFSFLPTITAFASALVFGTAVVTQLNDDSPLILIYKKIGFQVTVTAAPALSFLLLLGVADKSIQALALLIPLGICIGWLTSLALTPAVFVALSKEKLKILHIPIPSFSVSPLSRLAHWSSNNPIYVLTLHIVLFSLAALGLASLTIHETPLHWLNKKHPVVQDERTLNTTFNGIHQLTLTLRATPKEASLEENRKWLDQELKTVFKNKPEFLKFLSSDIEAAVTDSATPATFAERLTVKWKKVLQELPVSDDLQIANWSVALDILSELTHRSNVFLHPDMLGYVEKVQRFALADPHIRKTLSVVDFIIQAHQALFEGDPTRAYIPSTTNAAVQALQAYTKRHPSGLTARFINENATQTSITFFTTTRDPQQLTLLGHTITAFLKANPAPMPLQAEWTGTAYAYSSWQRNTTFSLIFWVTASFIIGALGIAALHKSAKQGIFSLLTAGYILFLSCGLGGLFYNTSGILFSATLLAPLLIVMLLTGLNLTSMRGNILAFGSWTGENSSTQWTGVLLPLCIGVSLLAFFSAYSPLRTTGLMTITSMVALTTTFYTALPLLMNTFQPVIFKKEVQLHTDGLAAMEEQNKSLKGTAPIDEEVVTENKEKQPEQPATNK